MTREEYKEFCNKQSDRIVAINKETHEYAQRYIDEESLVKVGDIIVNPKDNNTYQIGLIRIDTFGYFSYYATTFYHFTESDLIRWGYKTRKH